MALGEVNGLPICIKAFSSADDLNVIFPAGMKLMRNVAYDGGEACWKARIVAPYEHFLSHLAPMSWALSIADCSVIWHSSRYSLCCLCAQLQGPGFQFTQLLIRQFMDV